MAALFAGLELSESGLFKDITLLEASGRLGGRANTLQQSGNQTMIVFEENYPIKCLFTQIFFSHCIVLNARSLNFQITFFYNTFCLFFYTFWATHFVIFSTHFVILSTHFVNIFADFMFTKCLLNNLPL